MNLKALKEKRNALASEMQTIISTCEAETRNLDENENARFLEIRSEIENIDAEINAIKEEERNQTPVEIVENKIEERGELVMENMTKEQEIRAIESYIKKDYNAEELRAITTSSNGALVPTHLHGEVVKKLEECADVFSKTRIFSPVGGKLDILREDNIGNGAWVGEGSELSDADFTVEKVTLQGHRAGSTVQLSQSLINDAGIDVVAYAVDILIRRLGNALNRAIIDGKGQGQNQPEGLLLAPADCDVKSASKSAIDMDDIVELYNALNPEYLKDAVFIVGREVFNALAKLKDATGNYFLARDIAQSGTSYKMLGLPVLVSDVMPKNTGAGNERLVVLVNLNAAVATLISKAIELKTVSGDSKMALMGATLMVMDCYVDSRIINKDAVRILKTPQA